MKKVNGNSAPPEIIYSLKSSSLFSALAEREFNSLLSTSSYFELEKGETLFAETSEANSLFYIAEGSIKLLTYDFEGREKIVGIFSKGEVIWEGVMISLIHFPYSAVAINNVKVFQVSNTSIEKIVKNPVASENIIRLLSKKLHDANQRNLILSLEDPKARIAKFFIYNNQRSEGKPIKLKLEDIAASVSLRPETVSRKIRELINDGLIKKEGQSLFIILDEEGLIGISENS